MEYKKNRFLKISSNKNNWEQKITLLLYYTKYWWTRTV